MKPINYIHLTIAIIVVFFIGAGCDKNKDVILPSNELAPPGNLRALSLNGSVKLIWDASPFQSDNSFSTYRITTTGATTRVDSTTATTFTVPGLVNGTVDTFNVYTERDDGALSQNIRIVWGPTVRYFARRIFEFDSPHASGLEFATGDSLHFTSGGGGSDDNRPFIDLWIDGHNNAVCQLKSPNLPNINGTIGWRVTKFTQTAGTGLDQYVPIPDASTITSSSILISPTNIYFAITDDGNYARFITTDVQGTAPNRYIDLSIAYNSGPGAWAKR